VFDELLKDGNGKVLQQFGDGIHNLDFEEPPMSRLTGDWIGS
jgi:hypothetical protein